MSFDEEGKFRVERARMVEEQLMARGIEDARVLEAFHSVPRHLFVPTKDRARAYDDAPIPLGPEQSISQPFIVAHMLEQLRLTPTDRVLEIGTGSGYQTALLAELAAEVHSIEIDQALSAKAAHALEFLRTPRCELYVRDGSLGLPEKAPFDAIIVGAAAAEMPRALIRQLAPGGRLILPLTEDDGQTLILLTRTEEGLQERILGPVRFVRMRHEET